MPIKLSEFPSGGTINPSTDKIIVVREGSPKVDMQVAPGTAAGKAASDATKASVASVDSATTIGHLAAFTDTAGTIGDGGAPPTLGTAAAKNASDATKSLLSSVSAATISGNFPVFADTAGTVADSGMKPSDYPTFSDIFGPSGPDAKSGLVPSPGATPGTRRFLREDATWAPAGGGAVFVSDYGLPNGVNDATTFQNAFNAAVASNRTLVIDNPGGSAGTRWFLGTTIFDPAGGALGTPRTVSIDTVTGVYTFDRNHNFSSGDVVSFVGTNMGSGGGLTQVSAYTEYFFNRVSATTGRMYNSRANAIAGGVTGLYLPATGNTTAATFVTLATTANLTNGSGSVTVADASKIINGDTLNFAGSNGTTYYTVTNVVGNVVSFTPNYSGSTINSGATVWTSACDVTGLLTLEPGATCSFVGPSTNNNSFGTMIVTSIVGNTAHFNQPPNSALPTPGASQTLVINVWIDPKQNSGRKFKMVGEPGAVVCKTSSFSGNALFQWDTVGGLEIDGVEFWGRTYGYTPDPGIVNGDDGIRVFGSFGIKLKNCTFRYFGDSAWKLHTGSYFAAARSTTYPNAGTYCNNIEIDGCFVYDCMQVSTTNSGNAYQGGTRDIWVKNCYFENIGAGIKFATRAPGSENVYLIDNIIKKSGRHGFELDSYSNYIIDNNTIYDCNKYGIFIIANNLQPIGFEFNDCVIRGNKITAGPNTGATSGSGGIYFNPDVYPNGPLWNYRGLQIVENKVYDMPGLANPVNIGGGCYTSLRIERNTVDGCATTAGFYRLSLRANTTPGFDSAIVLEGNIARNCTGAKASMFVLIPTNGAAGGPYVRGIYAAGNQFDSTGTTLGSNASNDGKMFWLDYVADVMICGGNRMIGYGSNAIYVQTEGQNAQIFDNNLSNLNTATGVLISMIAVNGVYVADNVINQSNTGSVWLNIDRRCQNVRLGWNDVSQSARKTYGVSNVPITTAANGYQTREEYLAAAPTAGTWQAGSRYWLTAPAANTTPGAICTTAGTLTAITATGDSVTGQNTITNISSMSNICVGMYITHPGFTGTRQVTAMGTNSVTLNANATGDSTGGSLTVAAPTFKAMANIAA